MIKINKRVERMDELLLRETVKDKEGELLRETDE